MKGEARVLFKGGPMDVTSEQLDAAKDWLVILRSEAPGAEDTATYFFGPGGTTLREWADAMQASAVCHEKHMAGVVA